MRNLILDFKAEFFDFENVSVSHEMLLIFSERNLKVWNMPNLVGSQKSHDSEDPFFSERLDSISLVAVFLHVAGRSSLALK